MTSEEFWKGDPRLFSSYLKSFKKKEEAKSEFTNISNWLMGVYVFDGMTKALTNFGNGLAGNKSAKPLNYVSEPYDFKNNREQKLEKQREKVKKQNQENLNFWASIKK